MNIAIIATPTTIADFRGDIPARQFFILILLAVELSIVSSPHNPQILSSKRQDILPVFLPITSPFIALIWF
jgi:hypothetical protein